MISTVWTAQRCSQGYTEKRRGRKETEVARGIKGEIKRRERDPASNQFSTIWNTHRDSQSWVEKRRGREEIEATWWIKRRIQRGESSQASNLAPKQKWVLKIGFLKVQN